MRQNETSSVRRVRMMQVVHVRALEGTGDEESPFRFVDWYFTPEGKLLAFKDVLDEDKRADK